MISISKEKKEKKKCLSYLEACLSGERRNDALNKNGLIRIYPCKGTRNKDGRWFQQLSELNRAVEGE